ncbi:hypothetical protein MH117_19110 [Paenibacillus sp. ACRRX]|uniref:hypothetical protein n=1 Tax=Paenibacillus sp. ACRRX TaxID=2918206 RepID=UPI001EF523C0|nr:hypothetical protein [Paenibacillus sp. ACRRX]MCG7409521.1 hypothetical protein [Paenibacillus sp. ACRRX]
MAEPWQAVVLCCSIVPEGRVEMSSFHSAFFICPYYAVELGQRLYLRRLKSLINFENKDVYYNMDHVESGLRTKWEAWRIAASNRVY